MPENETGCFRTQVAIVETLDLVHRLPGKYLVCVAVVSRANETSRDGSETSIEAGRANNKNVRAREIRTKSKLDCAK